MVFTRTRSYSCYIVLTCFASRLPGSIDCDFHASGVDCNLWRTRADRYCQVETLAWKTHEQKAGMNREKKKEQEKEDSRISERLYTS